MEALLNALALVVLALFAGSLLLVLGQVLQEGLDRKKGRGPQDG